ncbi:hypothetical protein [Micromonospora nigra]|uniref:hypothetical protein n=1 Tax=Micromonospora nigra TaxID=145857 RepID=UPI001113016A|nr:hypothetical protein [Micromonospora nigra]
MLTLPGVLTTPRALRNLTRLAVTALVLAVGLGGLVAPSHASAAPTTIPVVTGGPSVNPVGADEAPQGRPLILTSRVGESTPTRPAVGPTATLRAAEPTPAAPTADRPGPAATLQAAATTGGASPRTVAAARAGTPAGISGRGVPARRGPPAV